MAEGLVARTAEAHQVLARPWAVIGLRVEDFEGPTLGRNLQGLFIRDGVAVLAGARIGTDGQEPGLHRARLGRRELDKQGLREDRPAGLGAYPRDGLPRLNETHALARVDGAHAPDRRATLPRTLEM